MTDTDRERYHLMMLRTVRELVADGDVLGFAQPGDDVELVHGRFIRKDEPCLEAPEGGTERAEWRAREVETIDGMIAAQVELLGELGVSDTRH